MIPEIQCWSNVAIIHLTTMVCLLDGRGQSEIFSLDCRKTILDESGSSSNLSASLVNVAIHKVVL